MTARGCPIHADFDPLSAGYLRDPLAFFDGEPVFYAPSIDYYVLTRFADIEQTIRTVIPPASIETMAPIYLGAKREARSKAFQSGAHR